MPIYDLQDGKTGAKYQVDFEKPPSEKDVDEAIASLRNSSKQQKDTAATGGLSEQVKSFATGAASSLAPTAGAWAGIQAMETLTAPAVAATVEFPPLSAAIAIGSGVVGAIGGSSAAEYLQDKVLPDWLKKKIEKAHEDHKLAFDAGSIAAGAAAFKVEPFKILDGGADIIAGRFGTKAAKAAAAQIGFGAGISVAQPLIQGQSVTAESVTMGVIQAALLGEPRFVKAHGANSPAAARTKAAEIEKNLTPEQKAEIEKRAESLKRTGLTPEDHGIVSEVISGKSNVEILHPDSEAEHADKTIESTGQHDEAIAGENIDEAILSAMETKREEVAPSLELKPEEQNAKPVTEEKSLTKDEVTKLQELGWNSDNISKALKKKNGLRALRENIAAKRKPPEIEAASQMHEEPLISVAEPEKAKSEPEVKPSQSQEFSSRIKSVKSQDELAGLMMTDDYNKLPEPDKQSLLAEARDRNEALEAEKKKQKALDEVAAKRKARMRGVPPTEQPFSETRSREQQEKLTDAARSGTAVATFDRQTGKVVIFPKGLSNRIQMLRLSGYSDKYIKGTLKSLIAHEEVHGAFDDAKAKEYHDLLTPFERKSVRKILDTVNQRYRSDVEIGHEAFRMRMQDLMGMTPDDIAQFSGTERLRLDTIYAMQKAVQVIRENLTSRKASGRAIAMIREAELKLNHAEKAAIARAAGTQQLSETRRQPNAEQREAERSTYENWAKEQEIAAAEYRASGDAESANELEQRAKEIRAKYIEKTFDDLQLSETRHQPELHTSKEQPEGKTPEDVAEKAVASHIAKRVSKQIQELEAKTDRTPSEDRLLHTLNKSYELLRQGRVVSGLQQKHDDIVYERALSQAEEIQKRREGVKTGSFINPTESNTAPAPSEFPVQAASDSIASRIIDELLGKRVVMGERKGLRNIKSALDSFIRRLQQEFKGGISEAQAKDLAVESLWKKIAGLSGEEIDNLLNQGMAKREKYQKGGFAYHGTPDPISEDAIKLAEQQSQTPQEFIESFIRMPQIWQYESLVNSKRVSKEQAVRFISMKVSERREFMRSLEAPVEQAVHGAKREPTAATVKRQDVDMVRKEVMLRQKREAALFNGIISRLTKEGNYYKTDIKPEEINFNGTKDYSGIHTFHQHQQGNVEAISKALTEDWRGLPSEPRAASKRIAVVMDKASGRVFMLSAYKRGQEVRLRDPMIVGKEEYTALQDMMKRYRLLHSIHLEEPVVGFRKAFGSYPEFSKKFMADAQQMQMHTDSYMPSPVSEHEALQMSSRGVRLERGTKSDEFGNRASAKDPMAEDKIKEMRKLSKEQKQRRLDELEKKERSATESESAKAEEQEAGRLRREIEMLDREPQLSDEYEGFGSNVTKGGSQYFDPAGLAGGAMVRGARGEILDKRPVSHYAIGKIYDRIKSELPTIESKDDVVAIIKDMAIGSSPIERSAIGKIGRAVLYHHAKAAREHNLELKKARIKDESVDPYPKGNEAIGIVAESIFDSLEEHGDNREAFAKELAAIANRPVAEKTPKPTKLQLQQRAAITPREPSVRELSTPKHPRQFQVYDESRPSPAIPEGTAIPEQVQYLEPSENEWLRHYIDTVSQPPEEKRVPLFEDYRKYNKRMTELGLRRRESEERPEISLFEGEGGLSYSETRRTVDDAMSMIGSYGRAFASRSEHKGLLSRMLDAAETLAKTISRRARNSIALAIGENKEAGASIKAMIAVKAVERKIRYTEESKKWMLEQSAKDEEFKLAQALIRGDKATYMPIFEKINKKYSDINRGRIAAGERPVQYFLDGFGKDLEENKIDPAKIGAIGLQYFKSLRRGLEQLGVNEGVIKLDGCTYSIDDSAKQRIGMLRRSVQDGINKSERLMSSGSWFERNKGKKWNAAAKKLMSELDYADAYWNNEQLRNGSIAAAREFDRQFDLEKSKGVNVEFDPEFVPGRYSAEFWNNDSVTFGHGSVLGYKTTQSKTFTSGGYYEAIGVDAYIPLSHDMADLVEHRVKQGMTKINKAAWRESWKSLKDEHTGLPLAVSVADGKVSAGKDIDPKAYELVSSSDGSQAAVLRGYDGLYKTLTEPSAIQNNLFGRAALRASQYLKHTLLGGDIFHLGRIQYYSLAISGWKARNFRKGWTALEFRPEQLDAAVRSGVVDPSTAAWLKERITFNDNGKPTSMNRMELVNHFEKSGLNVGMIQDAMFKDLMHNIPFLGKYQKWLFDKVTRGLMVNNAISEFERIQKLYPEMDANKIIKTVSKDINIFFGSIGRQGFFKSRTFMDMSNMVLLAPQWVEGIVKKDLAIPYKIATGLHNKQAVRLLTGRSQETAARSILRGMGAMFVLTQVINYITKGKPTWQNEDKEHTWDAYVGGGVYLSPLSIFNELAHDLVRYSETKPKFWDEIQQVGANKLSVYGRAAMVLASDKSAEGEYLTSTGAVLGEAGKQLAAPIAGGGPITGKSLVSMGRVMAEQGTPQDVKQMFSMVGIKLEVQRTALQRMQSEATKFSKKYKNQPFILLPTDEESYGKIRHLLSVGDTDGARRSLSELEKKTTERNIIHSMRMWVSRPLTGSHKLEAMWLNGMSEEERESYRQALMAKQQVFQNFAKLFTAKAD
jgi:hypothetical protein